MQNANKEYFPMLDILRIINCGSIFLYHLVLYGLLKVKENSFECCNLINGSIYLDAFFILSGFLLFYLYNNNFENLNIKSLKSFYVNRLIRVYPQYIFSTFAIILFGALIVKVPTDWTIIPVQILCIQSFIPELFTFCGNECSWYISCLFLSYLIFPFLCILVNYSKKSLAFIFAIYILVIYILYLSAKFEINAFFYLYMNPLFRFLEFAIGMYLAKFFIQNKEKSNGKYSIYIAALCFIILPILVFMLYSYDFHSNFYLEERSIYYSFITIPIFSIIIYSLAIYKNKFIENKTIHKTLKILAGLTFPFYMWQGFAIRLQRYYLHDIQHASLYITAILLIISVISYILFDKLLTKKIKSIVNHTTEVENGQ